MDVYFVLGKRGEKNMVEVLIVTEKGIGVRAKLSDWPLMRRGGVGVKAIMLHPGDKVATVVVINNKDRK